VNLPIGQKLADGNERRAGAQYGKEGCGGFGTVRAASRRATS
jgi:hypothetical protein